MASTGAVDEHELIVIKGLCCCNTALYPQIPECIGCSSKSELLCLVTQCCLKCGTPAFGCKAFDDDACLQCGCCCCAIGLKAPSTLCKSQGQTCCIVANARRAGVRPPERGERNAGVAGRSRRTTRSPRSSRASASSATRPSAAASATPASFLSAPPREYRRRRLKMRVPSYAAPAAPAANTMARPGMA